MKKEVIRTENRLCTCCMEEHEVKVIRTVEKGFYKEVSLEYEAEYFYCDLAEELYMDEEQMTRNDARMKDAYRKKKGLLTAGEISSIRVKYGVSQGDLCTLLGWGGKTITRYEGHQVQDKAHDSILRKLDGDPAWFLDLLSETKEVIAAERLKKYYDMAIALYEAEEDAYLRKAIEAKYAKYRDKENYNGNMKLSLDKVVEVIRYFSASPEVTSLYKVKLMKLLWYADFLSYKLRGKSMMGLVYQALPMGAVPIGHDTIIDLHGITYEEVEMGEGTAYHFVAPENRAFSFLSQEDKEILDEVIAKLGRKSKDEIVDFMHREKAYISTPHRRVIAYDYATSLQI